MRRRKRVLAVTLMIVPPKRFAPLGRRVISSTGTKFSRVQSDRIFFAPIVHPDELERAVSPTKGEDFLLHCRATCIADHVRLTRVFIHKRRLHGDSWTLTGEFQDGHYQSFLKSLREEDLDVCGRAFYGDIFSTDPTGIVRLTPFGPLVTICHSMRYFCKFANLGLMSFEVDVPPEVRFASLIIAVRVMLKYEALDFFVDPRGTVPESVARTITRPIEHELEWLAGCGLSR